MGEIIKTNAENYQRMLEMFAGKYASTEPAAKKPRVAAPSTGHEFSGPPRRAQSRSRSGAEEPGANKEIFRWLGEPVQGVEDSDDLAVCCVSSSGDDEEEARRRAAPAATTQATAPAKSIFERVSGVPFSALQGFGSARNTGQGRGMFGGTTTPPGPRMASPPTLGGPSRLRPPPAAAPVASGNAGHRQPRVQAPPPSPPRAQGIRARMGPPGPLMLDPRIHWAISLIESSPYLLRGRGTSQFPRRQDRCPWNRV